MELMAFRERVVADRSASSRKQTLWSFVDLEGGRAFSALVWQKGARIFGREDAETEWGEPSLWFPKATKEKMSRLKMDWSSPESFSIKDEMLELDGSFPFFARVCALVSNQKRKLSVRYLDVEFLECKDSWPLPAEEWQDMTVAENALARAEKMKKKIELPDGFVSHGRALCFSSGYKDEGEKKALREEDMDRFEWIEKWVLKLEGLPLLSMQRSVAVGRDSFSGEVRPTMTMRLCLLNGSRGASETDPSESIYPSVFEAVDSALPDFSLDNEGRVFPFSLENIDGYGLLSMPPSPQDSAFAEMAWMRYERNFAGARLQVKGL